MKLLLRKVCGPIPGLGVKMSPDKIFEEIPCHGNKWLLQVVPTDIITEVV